VLEELVALGVRRAVRVGTARAIDATLATGDLLAATGVVADDGTSRALGAAPHQTLDGPLTDHLVAAADRDGIIASHDLLYAPDAVALTEAWTAAGAVAADLETGALAAVAARHGIAFAAVVTIAVDAAGMRCDDEALTAAGDAAGRVATQALA
jgi:uridine phosphorylase